jgi:hypothetical protein
MFKATAHCPTELPVLVTDRQQVAATRARIAIVNDLIFQICKSDTAGQIGEKPVSCKAGATADR